MSSNVRPDRTGRRLIRFGRRELRLTVLATLLLLAALAVGTLFTDAEFRATPTRTGWPAGPLRETRAFGGALETASILPGVTRMEFEAEWSSFVEGSPSKTTAI